jgi:hypothetical protein
VFKVNPSLATILLCEKNMKILNVNEDIDLSFKWGKVSQLYATLTLGSQLSVKCKGP